MEANKQAMREDQHKKDQEFNNDLLTIAHNASFHLHHGVRSSIIFFYEPFLCALLDCTYW